jgi:enamine deaminase RidA (YjgF/YER057c/UK114 family)
MSPITINPAELHDPTPFGYSHSVRISGGTDVVFVAGQYASARDGSVVSADFGEQLQQALHNVAVAVGAHGLDLSDVVQLRTYVVNLDFDKLGAITGAVQAIWGDRPPTNTLIGVAALATPELVVEIEAVAAGS